jgi:hypothetical protein
MPTIQADASQEQLLRAVEQLKPDELEHFVAQVVALRAARIAPSLPHDEAALLERINQGLAPQLQHRFDVLVERRRQATLTAEEHSELVALTDQIEQFDADRATALAQLAVLRRTSVSELMQSLGLQPPTYV